jgi:hypothetical protein
VLSVENPLAGLAFDAVNFLQESEARNLENLPEDADGD